MVTVERHYWESHMGIYIYTIRKNPIKVELDDGTTVLAACLVYAYKPVNGWGNPAFYNRMVGRVDASAERALSHLQNQEEVPTHVVFFDAESKEAYSLYRVHNLPERVYDDTFYKSKYVDEYLGGVDRVRVGRRKVYRQVTVAEGRRRAEVRHAEGVASGRIVELSING